jgi:hypothetical protein
MSIGKNIDYTLENIQNIKCNISQDTSLFSKLIDKYKNTFQKPFTIICAVADTYGFGDTIFFVKFVKYIIKQYDNIKISLVISKGKRNFISKILKPCKIYDGDSVTEISDGDKNIDMYIGIVEGDLFTTQIPVYGDIMFIAPKTNTEINLLLSNRQTIQDNSYSLSEYNYMKKPGATITTGIRFSRSNNVGILLNNFKSTSPPEKGLYSITYIYTHEDMLEEFEFNPQKIKFKINDKNIWNIETLFYNLGVYFEDEILYADNYNYFQYTYEHNLAIQIKFILAFRDYLNDLVKYTCETIKVYYRGDSIDNIKSFLDDIDIEWIRILMLESLVYNLYKNPNLTYVELGIKSHEEMLVLYEHTIPIIFISGDQSITDFVSVNKYYKDSCENGIYYQIFSWKQRLADYLGGDDYIVCKISPNMLNKISHDPNFDFRYKGMLYIHSVLIYSLQYKLHKLLGNHSINLCPDLDSPQKIDSLIKTNLLPDFNSRYIDYTTNGNLNNNLSISLGENTITIKENSDPFDIRMILGNIRNNLGTWLMGTEISDIYIKYNSRVDDYSNLNVSVSLLRSCNSLQLTLNPFDKGFIIPRNIHILIIYIILEDIRRERIIDNNLVRTYGSFIIGNDCCNNEITDRLKINPSDRNINTLLFQENIKGKYITFRDYLVNGNVSYFEMIITKVIFVLKILQSSNYMIVHNSLYCENIYLELIGVNDCNVKITGFDNASFSLEDIRFGNNSSSQFEFSVAYDILFLMDDIVKHLNKKSELEQELFKNILKQFQNI